MSKIFMHFFHFSHIFSTLPGLGVNVDYKELAHMTTASIFHILKAQGAPADPTKSYEIAMKDGAYGT